jgi:hypothetical protein
MAIAHKVHNHSAPRWLPRVVLVGLVCIVLLNPRTRDRLRNQLAYTIDQLLAKLSSFIYPSSTA